MINKKRFRELLGQKVEGLSDRQIDTIRDDFFYPLGFALFQWSTQRSKEDFEERTDKKRKK